MPVISTQSSLARSLEGVHLFHFGTSQCSQRVRLGLAEKGVPYTSRIVNLPRGEHLEPWYGEIHPGSVVPALVHDGRVVIESTDILEYIDATFPGPTLVGPEDEAAVAQWLQQSNACKAAIRVLSFEYLFRVFAQKSSTQLERLRERAEAHQESAALYRFHERYAQEGLSVDEVHDALAEFRSALAEMDDALASGGPWLLGERVTLADISWIGDVHRLALMRFPLDDTPHVARWYRAFRARGSFRSAVAAHEPFAVLAYLRGYAAYRALRGTGPRQTMQRLVERPA